MCNQCDHDHQDIPNSHSSSVNLKYLKLRYHYLISYSLYLILIPLLTILSPPLSSLIMISKEDFTFTHLYNLLILNLLPIISCSSILIFLVTLYLASRRRKVYLVDFACYNPHPALKASKTTCIDRIVQSGAFSEESIEFQRKVFERSGIGDEAYLPDSVTGIPPRPTLYEARKEAEMLMFGAIDEVLEKTGVNPRDIGIVVVNCSLYSPSPSLACMVVNRYKLRGNVKSYSLAGMGCSAGLISIDLAQRLLQVHSNSYALVISTEITSLNWYYGNDRSMLVSNSLFKMGVVAILLSNKRSDRYQSKYQLTHVVRTHKRAQDKSYTCVFFRKDESERLGVSLSKDVMAMASEALKTNITALGPMVLPMSEQLLFLATLIAKTVLCMKKIRPYIPDFKFAFEHFCIHAGGRAVLDAIEKSLELTQCHMEPAKMTLYRFGNTSSSSVWYQLAYMEAKRRINKGDRIWQIGFGSGFKCNSVVWHALRTINLTREKNLWMEEIDKFPVEVPNVSTIVVSTKKKCL